MASKNPDRTTWNEGCTKGHQIAAARIANEDFAGYYDLIITYTDANSRDTCRYYQGILDGCRAAMREYRKEQGNA
jgi:hypothetical protein